MYLAAEFQLTAVNVGNIILRKLEKGGVSPRDKAGLKKEWLHGAEFRARYRSEILPVSVYSMAYLPHLNS